MMEIRVLGRYRDQAGTAGQAVRATVGRASGRRAALGSTESALSRNIEPSRPALLLVAGIADGRSEKPGFRGPVRNGQNLERELIKGHGRPLSTQIGRSLYPTTMVGHGPQSRSQLSHTSFKHLRLI